jgi:group I intron endonuclease
VNNYGYIYKTTNLINGKIYIGQKKGNFVSYYFGSGKILKNSMKKRGKDNFKIEILAYAKSKKELDKLEIKFISEYRKQLGKDRLYNISKGGDEIVGNTGRTRFKKGMTPWNKGIKTGIIPRSAFKKGSKLSSKTKERISLATSGKNNPFYGKTHSFEALEKMRKTWFKKGQILSKEIRRKISMAQRGDKHWTHRKT